MNRPISAAFLATLIAAQLLTGAASLTAAEALPFWKRPAAEVPRKLLPGKLELQAEPDLSRPLAMFDPDHKITNPAVFPFVNQDQNQVAYRVIPDGCVKGAKPFSDRLYTITTLPERFAKLTLFQTKMSHKSIVDSRFGITLSATRPVHFFLALDERLLANFTERGAPSWFHDFTPTGETVGLDNPFDKTVDAKFLIFVKQCPAGRIILGPCGADPKFNSMYFGFAAEAVEAAK